MPGGFSVRFIHPMVSLLENWAARVAYLSLNCSSAAAADFLSHLLAFGLSVSTFAQNWEMCGAIGLRIILVAYTTVPLRDINA